METPYITLACGCRLMVLPGHQYCEDGTRLMAAQWEAWDEHDFHPTETTRAAAEAADLARSNHFDLGDAPITVQPLPQRRA